MSPCLHYDNDKAKAIAIPPVFSENSQANKMDKCKTLRKTSNWIQDLLHVLFWKLFACIQVRKLIIRVVFSPHSKVKFLGWKVSACVQALTPFHIYFYPVFIAFCLLFLAGFYCISSFILWYINNSYAFMPNVGHDGYKVLQIMRDRKCILLFCCLEQ